MKLSDVLYSLGWQTIRPILGLAGLFSSKLAEAVRGREAAAERMRAWVEESGRSDGGGPASRAGGLMLWLHGASAGELVGAAPIVARLRTKLPALRLVVTYSSPSGVGAARRLEPDYHGFVPLDLRKHTDAAIEAVDPAALVYAKSDVWPNLTASARRAGVPIGLVNATVRAGSRRLRQPGKAVLRDAYRSLDAVGAVSEGDAGRIMTMGVRGEAVAVTGDAAFDEALRRLRRSADAPPRLPPRARGTIRLIAGSTWAEDDAFLMEAVADVPEVELVLVPHEPTPEAVERIRDRVEQRLRRSPRVFSQLGPEAPTRGAEAEPYDGSAAPHDSTARRVVAPPPLIVDAVGFLAELYPEGDIAYVGGGLTGTGLHSVVEPAAAGRPVLFGKRHDRREATELVEAGGALEVEPANLHATLVALLEPELRRRMGKAAAGYVGVHTGAGRAGADLVADLLSRPRGPAP